MFSWETLWFFSEMNLQTKSCQKLGVTVRISKRFSEKKGAKIRNVPPLGILGLKFKKKGRGLPGLRCLPKPC
ncbi:MAG: hypothetical protein D6762_00670 [Candidatus Neomarinimicrobiota bacterium]|nr:MAG: hypothetical protein D6762_00670 [Candidatus Neomarinimicrobiota bacterium]